MEIKDLKSLIKMVTDTDITEFKMENNEVKVLIKRGPDKEYVHMTAPVAAPVVAAPAAMAAPVNAPSVAAAAPVVNDKYETITSPIVGTFYRKPSPEAAEFCNIGDVVEAGQVLCLVEAMKLFNEIDAEFKCRVVEIVKENAAPVEYGEALFIVERL